MKMNRKKVRANRLEKDNLIAFKKWQEITTCLVKCGTKLKSRKSSTITMNFGWKRKCGLILTD